MLKFSTRTLARAFAKKVGKSVVDLGKDANGQRWGVLQALHDVDITATPDGAKYSVTALKKRL